MAQRLETPAPGTVSARAGPTARNRASCKASRVSVLIRSAGWRGIAPAARTLISLPAALAALGQPEPGRAASWTALSPSPATSATSRLPPQTIGRTDTAAHTTGRRRRRLMPSGRVGGISVIGRKAPAAVHQPRQSTARQRLRQPLDDDQQPVEVDAGHNALAVKQVQEILGSDVPSRAARRGTRRGRPPKHPIPAAPAAMARSSPRRLSTGAENTTSPVACKPAKTSSAPAICGTRFGCTKLAASTRGSPAAARRLQSSARTVGPSVAGSFRRPSRGPTSYKTTVAADRFSDACDMASASALIRPDPRRRATRRSRRPTPHPPRAGDRARRCPLRFRPGPCRCRRRPSTVLDGGPDPASRSTWGRLLERRSFHGSRPRTR